ncbi:hypothetical protein EDD11_006293 [Mortierella claussenii]|nr:hypothetical protein EDD11_006293 [Mortierella claussenii]
MFFPWSLFFVNFILAVTRFLAVGAIGAALALYSRLRGEHANSIRWVRQGGYLEMLAFLINTRNDISKKAKGMLLFTIIATFAATIAARGAVRFISASTRRVDTSMVVTKTAHFVSKGISATLEGWSGSVINGQDIVDVMKAMINGTSSIPNPVPGMSYSPRTTGYETACKTLDIYPQPFLFDRDPLVLDHNGCARAVITVLSGYEDLTAQLKVKRRSDDRWSMLLPIQTLDVTTFLSIDMIAVHEGRSCGAFEYTGGFADKPKNGLSKLPPTSITKCVLPTGHIISMAISTVHFMATSAAVFRNASNDIFQETDDLSIAMEAALLKSAKGKTANLFMELSIINSTITSLTCYSAPNQPAIGIACMYAFIETVITQKQEADPVLAAYQEGGKLDNAQNYSLTMDLSHITTKNDSTPVQTSLAGIKDANTAAARYFASLGQNFYVDWERGYLTVIYDTVETEPGLDIPLWLITVVPIIGAAAAVFWAAVEYLVDGRYTRSLYKTLAIPMGPQLDCFAPMLMRAKVDPLEFEGIPVVPAVRSDKDASLDIAVSAAPIDTNGPVTAIAANRS